MTNKSNSAEPAVTSDPRTMEFSESASELKRTVWPKIRGCARNVRAVAADPVNAIMSCPDS